MGSRRPSIRADRRRATRTRPLPISLTGSLVLALAAGTAVVDTAAATPAPILAPHRAVPLLDDSDLEATTPFVPTVIGKRKLGKSVQGRAIRAYHLGKPKAKTTAVILGSMHGNEQAGIQVVNALRAGRPVVDVNLWVIPTMNPDGVAANRRGNAHGVDLNRNFPHKWAPLTGSYYSGPKPLSEPESRAVRRFLNKVDPTYVVSFHQPLHGVGASSERKPFQRRLARGLGLPINSFNCSGVCHGTMTSWFNARHKGTAITVEFGSSPKRGYLRGRATAGTLRAVRGARP